MLRPHDSVAFELFGRPLFANEVAKLAACATTFSTFRPFNLKNLRELARLQHQLVKQMLKD